MNKAELVERILGGEFWIVGECRGVRIDGRKYCDKKTGKAMPYVAILYIVERSRTFEHLLVQQRMPSNIIDPSQVVAPIGKGDVCAFPIESMEKKDGILVSVRMGTASPEKLEAAD